MSSSSQKRNPTEARELRQTALKTESIGLMLDSRSPSLYCSRGCDRNCGESVHFDDVLQLREQYWGKTTLHTRELRRRFLHTALSAVFQTGGSFRVGNKQVCERYWLAAASVPHGRQYQNVRASVVAGHFQLEATETRARAQPLREHVETWLQRYAALVGDKLPVMRTVEQQNAPTNVVRYRLPQYTLRSLWSEYQSDVADHGLGEYQCSERYFAVVWKDIGNLELAAQGGGFKVCSICFKFAQQLSLSGQPALRARLKDARAAHLALQAQERRKYYKHRLKASSDGAKYLSLIIDGMDQVCMRGTSN